MDRPCIAGSLCSLVTAPALSSRDMLITSVDAASTFEELCEEVRDMCSLRQGQPLTLKWVDSEGSPRSPAVRGARAVPVRRRVLCARRWRSPFPGEMSGHGIKCVSSPFPEAQGAHTSRWKLGRGRSRLDAPWRRTATSPLPSSPPQVALGRGHPYPPYPTSPLISRLFQ